MADLAKRTTKKSRPTQNGYGQTVDALKTTSVVGQPTNSKDQITTVQLRAARMMARGTPIALVARKLADWIVPNEPVREKQLQKARNRLRSWGRTQAFRDAIWEEAVGRLDAKSGEILEGIARKAASGRVDAARLAMEVTGRHSPHTEIQPAQVNVVFEGVPRPQSPKEIAEAEVVDVDAEVEPDEL